MSATIDQGRQMVAYVAPQHVATVSTATAMLRDIAEAMFNFPEGQNPNASGDMADWIAKLDFLGNAILISNDEMIDALQAAGIPSVLCSASHVSRNRLVAANGMNAPYDMHSLERVGFRIEGLEQALYAFSVSEVFRDQSEAIKMLADVAREAGEYIAQHVANMAADAKARNR